MQSQKLPLASLHIPDRPSGGIDLEGELRLGGGNHGVVEKASTAAEEGKSEEVEFEDTIVVAAVLSGYFLATSPDWGQPPSSAARARARSLACNRCRFSGPRRRNCFAAGVSSSSVGSANS